MRDADLLEGIFQLDTGRQTLALERFTVAAEIAEDPEDRRAAISLAARVNLDVGRPYEAVAWAEQLRDHSDELYEPDVLEAAAWVSIGDGPQALSLLEPHVHKVGSVGETVHYPLNELIARAYALDGQFDACAEASLVALSEHTQRPELWRTLGQLASMPDFDLDPFLATVPGSDLLSIFGYVWDLPAEVCDRFAELAWARWPSHAAVLAFVAQVGNRLELERALEWSARQRAAGASDHCALLGAAANRERPAGERVRAAVLAGSAFADDRAEPLLELAVVAVADDDLVEVFDDTLTLATDDLVDAFVIIAASTAHRSLLLAAALLERGADGPALALVRHAIEETVGQPEALRDAVAETLTPTTVTDVLAALRQAGAPDVAALLRAAA